MAIATDLPAALLREVNAAVSNAELRICKQPMRDTAHVDEPLPPPVASTASSTEWKNETSPADEALPQLEGHDLFWEHMEEIDVIAAGDQDEWLELMSRC